jgi:PRC-barrel domain
MADVWVYGLEIFPVGRRPDLSGFEVVSSDGDRIGKVDEATDEASASWIVVDTGFWIFGKKRMIPAGAVKSVDFEERVVTVIWSREDIKNAPDDDEARRNDSTYRDEVGKYYDPYQSPRPSAGPADAPSY